MPQMAPINWLSLFLIFSITFMLFNILNYYTSIPTSKKYNNLTSINYNSMNWKW